MRSSNRVILHS